MWLMVNRETKVLPNQNIRTSLVSLLFNFSLKIPVNFLRINDLGKSLKAMLKHPQETPSNKKMLKKLIDGWHYQLFDIQPSYIPTKPSKKRSRTEEDQISDYFESNADDLATNDTVFLSDVHPAKHS
ncbi:MAG: hypothetical protein MHPSP_004245, partial [Paramarteilia canceri]